MMFEVRFELGFLGEHDPSWRRLADLVHLHRVCLDPGAKDVVNDISAS